MPYLDQRNSAQTSKNNAITVEVSLPFVLDSQESNANINVDSIIERYGIIVVKLIWAAYFEELY